MKECQYETTFDSLYNFVLLLCTITITDADFEHIYAFWQGLHYTPHPLSGNASLNSDFIPVGFPRGKASPSVTLVGHQKLSSVFNDF